MAQAEGFTRMSTNLDPSNWTFTIPPGHSGSNRFPRFDDATLDGLRSRLVEYVAAVGVDLRKKGTRLIGICPVHKDTKPSFAVFGTKLETCGCYPCGFKGSVFALSKWLGRSSTFPEAIKDVANVLGVSLPQPARSFPARAVTVSLRPVRQPEPPFVLSAAQGEQVHAARLALSDAFWAGDEIVDRIVESLGIDRETLRLASWRSCGLGLSAGSYGKPVWLCYAYPQGLKWRNPDSSAKPRFEWLAGRATAPWRWEWASKDDVRTVYITEGESDCLALIATGLETDGTAACVASPGTSFPQAWAPLFRGKRVVICFDLDDPGRIATGKVAAILKGHAAEVLTWKGTVSHE